MKKLLCSLILLLAGLVLTNNYAQAAIVITPGDLLKTANNSGVYYYGIDLKRHLFSNEITFWSWHTGSWKDQNIKVISQDEFDSLDTGNNITMRPGNSFIKFDNSEILYAVEPGGILCEVNPTFANNQKIWKVIVQSSFQTDYTKSFDCSLSDYTLQDDMPEGSIFRYTDGIQTFYMSSDGSRPIDMNNGLASNGFKSNSIIIIKDPAPGSSARMRTAITAKEDTFSIDKELNLRGDSVVSNVSSGTIRGCNIDNGKGQQSSSDGVSWSNCRATVCDTNYQVTAGACALKPGLQPALVPTKNGSISKISTDAQWLSDGGFYIDIYWLSDVSGIGYYRYLYGDNQPYGDWIAANETKKITEGYLSKTTLNYLPYDTVQNLQFKVANSSNNTETTYSTYRFFTPSKQTRTTSGTVNFSYSYAPGGTTGTLTDVAITVSATYNGMLEYRELYSDGSPMQEWIGLDVMAGTGDSYQGTFHKDWAYGSSRTFEFRISAANKETYASRDTFTLK